MDPPASTASADAVTPPAPPSRFSRAWASRPARALRVVVMLLPFVWLARHIDFAAVARGAARVGWGPLAACLAIQLAGSSVLSFRWRCMLRTYGAAPARLPSTAYLFRSNLAANYAAFIPAPAADEGMRVLRTLHVFPEARAAVYMVLLAERIVGLTGLLLLASIAWLVAPSSLAPLTTLVLQVGVTVAVALALAAFLAPTLLARRPAWRHAVARVPLVGPTLSALPAPRRLRDLALPLALSVGVHFVAALMVWIVMSRLDARATLGLCARVQPLVLLAMAVPVTPTGLGQRELVFATLYGLAGVPAAAAITSSLLSYLLALAQGAIGGAVLAAEHALGGLRGEKR